MNEVVVCNWAGESLELLADRAVYWTERKTLIIADPHFGKPSAFRQAGVPVPMGTTAADLERLTTLLADTAAERLVVLGDFFHHRTGQCDRTMDMLEGWRRSHEQLNMVIIMGNHDRSSDEPPAHWNVEFLRKPLEDGPFLYCHEPCEKEGLFVMSGHIHPSITLRDNVGHALRLPCFLFSKGCSLLPAFGGFTGTARVLPKAGDKVYGIAEGQVIPIPVKAR